MADLSVNFAGIHSPNPFWLASGPPTNTYVQVAKACRPRSGNPVWSWSKLMRIQLSTEWQLAQPVPLRPWPGPGAVINFAARCMLLGALAAATPPDDASAMATTATLTAWALRRHPCARPRGSPHRWWELRDTGAS